MIRFSRLTVVQVAFIATAITAVHGAPEPLEILRQSILCHSRVDFSGIRTFVLFEDGEKLHGVEQKIDCKTPETLRIVVIAPESERGKLCLITGRESWEYYPGTRRAVYTKLPPREQVMRTRLSELDRLAERMNLQYVGVESIAGRPTHVIKVYTPRGLPVKKSWVDAEYHVELKTQRFDSRSRVKSSLYYTHIDYSPSFAPGIFDFEPPAGVTVVHAEQGTEYMTLQQAEKKAGFAAVLPTYLPPGYNFCSSRTAVIEAGGRPTIWLTFSNGADTFSLFERPASGELDPIRHDRAVTWQAGDYRFTLVGTLSGAEAQRVKVSIKP